MLTVKRPLCIRMIDTGNKGSVSTDRLLIRLVFRLFVWYAILTALCGCLANVEALQTWTPLYSAVQAGDSARVAELLEYPNVRSEIEQGQWSGFGMLGWSTPLIAAAERGQTQIVDELLKAGANPNTRWTVGLGLLASGTPLFAAASLNHAATVAVLLEAGANPNNPDNDLFLTGQSTSPLYNAAIQGNTEMMKALLEAGANPNIDPQIPLLIQCSGRTDCSSLLLGAETVEALVKAGTTQLSSDSVLFANVVAALVLLPFYVLAHPGGNCCDCWSNFTFSAGAFLLFLNVSTAILQSLM